MVVTGGALVGGTDVVEGLVDHQALGIHHVREGERELAWDVGFLLLGAAQIAGGWAIARAAERSPGRADAAGAD